MTGTTPGGSRILGSLRSEAGAALVRLEDRYDTDIDDLWSAITDPDRVRRWYGEVEGDLRPGGEFRLYIEADGWEGTGRIEVCEKPRRLRVTTRESEESWQKGQGAEPFDEVIDATLTAEGDHTLLVVEVQGMPLDKVQFYGVGWQIHLESLAGHVAGRDRGDTEARWGDLLPAYEDLARRIG